MTVSATFKLSDGTLLRRDLPVCSHRTMVGIVSPIAERLNLDLIKGWGEISDVDLANFPTFLEQLTALINAIKNDPDLKSEHKNSLTERFELLKNYMNEGFAIARDLVVEF